MERIEAECVVIGAGVIGLAVARELAQAGREVVILEAEMAVGTGISSRNSEVIHAGIYYPTGSLKARLCVSGRALLYDYCRERGIEHRRIGKLIVATRADHLPMLEAIFNKALANGVDDLTRLNAAEAHAMEPELRCLAAIYSPSTGIIDAQGLMLGLLGDAEAAGVTLALGAKVDSARSLPDGGADIEVSGETAMWVRCKLLVNCAGLGAQRIANATAGLQSDAVPRLYLAKGNYFALQGRSPFSRLIYPVPEPGGLGIHLTLDLAGQARFGPDVEWVEHVDLQVAAVRASAFEDSIRQYWPALPRHKLSPAYAGVRPKISGPDEPPADFAILGAAAHGCRGQIHLFGIESPGLTSALAIAKQVANLANSS